MKTSIILLTTLSIFFSSVTNTWAQQTTSEVLGNEEETANELEQKEEERENGFLGQLLLSLPALTDNPSHIITFIDPSEEKNGVQLEIDSQSFTDIQSPYSLPALSIGKHELRFKFVDKYGSTQILEKDIIIIPRPPVISSPIFNETSLVISGTGLSNSDLILIYSSGKNIKSEETQINEDGAWEISIAKDQISQGIYTFSAYTRRYGYASNLAEPVTFEIGKSEQIILNNNDNDISFSFSNIDFSKLGSIISQNKDLVILLGGIFVLGFVFSSLLAFLFRDKTETEKIKVLEKKITNGKNNSKEKTLREKLSGEKKIEENIEKKEEQKEQPEKILTKIDFLKDFKKFDPDNSKGEEK